MPEKTYKKLTKLKKKKCVCVEIISILRFNFLFYSINFLNIKIYILENKSIIKNLFFPNFKNPNSKKRKKFQMPKNNLNSENPNSKKNPKLLKFKF